MKEAANSQMNLITVSLLAIHVAFGAVWLGGAFFVEMVLTPNMFMIPLSPTVGAKTGSRFTWLVWVSLGMLTATGVLITYINEGLTANFLLGDTRGQILLVSMLLTLVAILNGLLITTLTSRIGSKDQLKVYAARIWIPRLVRLNSVVGLVTVVMMVIFTQGAAWY